jgi:hypothetical protein
VRRALSVFFPALKEKARVDVLDGRKEWRDNLCPRGGHKHGV